MEVSIHPAGVEMKGRVVIGSREDAELQARDMIGDWLKKYPTQGSQTERRSHSPLKVKFVS